MSARTASAACRCIRPRYTVIKVATGEDHGTWDSWEEVAMCLAFAQLSPDQVEVLPTDRRWRRSPHTSNACAPGQRQIVRSPVQLQRGRSTDDETAAHPLEGTDDPLPDEPAPRTYIDAGPERYELAALDQVVDGVPGDAALHEPRPGGEEAVGDQLQQFSA